jgi:hypothetical protein
LVVAGGFLLFARRKLRVGVLALLVFHLHLLFDFLGSRGPSPDDLWPIFYFGPFSKDPMWLWHGQWRLDAWPNQVFTWILLAAALWLALRRGDSFVGVVSRWADEIFVRVLRKWRDALQRRL